MSTRLVALLMVAIAMTGCNTTPVYDAAKACSIDADHVGALLDTDRYEASSKQWGEIPSGTDASTRGIYCSATVGERRLLAQVEVVGEREVARRTALLDNGKDPYTLGDGRAAVAGRSAMWACGSVLVSIEVSDDQELSLSKPQLQEALADLAQAVTCYQLADQP